MSHEVRGGADRGRELAGDLLRDALRVCRDHGVAHVSTYFATPAGGGVPDTTFHDAAWRVLQLAGAARAEVDAACAAYMEHLLPGWWAADVRTPGVAWWDVAKGQFEVARCTGGGGDHDAVLVAWYRPPAATP